MRWVLVLIAAVGVQVARADETDDALARKLGAVVRDFRQPTTARAEAARTLGKLGPRASAAVPDLVAVFDRLRGAEQETLQEALVEALGQIGSAAKPALANLAKGKGRSTDIDQALKRATEQILTASDSQDVELLLQQLLSRDAATRLRAVKALGDLGPGAKAAAPALLAVLGDTDADVRRGAITALRLVQPGTKPPEALVKAIAVDLKDPDANLRLLAVRTLGRIGPAAAGAAADLEVLRTDPDADVRRAATDALLRVSVPGP